MKNIAAIIILTTCLVLTACQQASKTNNNITNTSVADVNELLINITIDALKEQDYIQAQRSINALILSNDENVWDFIMSAIIRLPQELSMEIIELSLSKDSVKNSSTQLYGIAKIFMSYKETDQALKYINQSIQLNQKYLEARYWRARLLTLLKEYDKAESDFKFIVKQQPKNSNYSEQYASFLQETKQYSKAQKILANQEVTAEILFKRIVFILQADDEIIAQNLYQKLKDLEVDENNKNNKYFLIAEAAYFLKNFKESEDYYRKVSGGDNYLDARDMVSLILFEAKRYDDAIEVLHQLQNAEEKYAVKAYRLESQIKNLQGSPEEALQTLTRSLQIIPNNHTLLYDRAMLNESLNKMNLVKKDLLQIINEDPNNFDALNALGYSMADHDMELNKAHEYILEAIALSPDNPAIIDSLGWIQYKLGMYEEAQESFNNALEKDINDSELYFHLYQTLLKLNKAEEATLLLKKAKALFPDNNKILSL